MRANRHALQSLLNFLSRKFANKYRNIWDFEDGTIAVFVRDKLMLRNMQTLTVTVTVEARLDFQELVVVIVASGGRNGIFRLDMWGAENSAEQWAKREITNMLARTDNRSRITRQTTSDRPME